MLKGSYNIYQAPLTKVYSVRKNQDFKLVGYCNVDCARDKIEQKSTSDECHYLRPFMISWVSKKHNSIALSTAEAKFVSAACCYSQLLWVKYQLEDYSSIENNIPLYCDNTSAINLSKNPYIIQRSNMLR